MKAAMISAFLSALYDYETDWIRVPSFDHSIYRSLLFHYVPEGTARTIGWNLFEDDWNNRLSTDGLERGSIAFTFYAEVIGSNWLKKYSAEEINHFGRNLQIIDDLIDLDEDRKQGNTNCFLTDNADSYQKELAEFVQSDFWKTLEKHSLIYYKIRRQLFPSQLRDTPGVLKLVLMTRPWDAIFAFVLVLIGFKLGQFSWIPAIVSGLTFAGLTLSIMVVNDLIDRERDVQKGKILAMKYPGHVFAIWKWISIITAIFVVLQAVISWRSALLSLIVWFLGSFYSVLRPRYPFNNLIVAICGGSPVLVGMVYLWSWIPRSFIIFLVILITVLIIESMKDIQDIEGDAGYKYTLATAIGRKGALALTFPLCVAAAIAVLFFPHSIVRYTSLCFAAVALFLGISFTRPSSLTYAQHTVDIFLAALLIILIFI